MKKSKYTEEQIAFALRQAETGTRVEEVCRQLGISQATFFNWKKKYSGLGVPELRRLHQLEEENAQLKKLVADLSLDKQMLQDVIKKSCKASKETGTGRVSPGCVPGIGPTGMQSAAIGTSKLVLWVTSPRFPIVDDANEGNCLHPCSIRLPQDFNIATP